MNMDFLSICNLLIKLLGYMQNILFEGSMSQNYDDFYKISAKLMAV